MTLIVPQPLRDLRWTSAGNVTAPIDTNENILATVSIPVGTIGKNSKLLLTYFYTFSGSGSKTVRIRAGGIGGTVISSGAETTNPWKQLEMNWWFLNALNSQIGHPSGSATVFGSNASAATTATVDFASAQDIVFTAQKATAADAIVLRAFEVALHWAR